MLKIALPEMSRIAIELKKLYPNVPVMGFARGAGYANPTLQRAGYDVVTVDANIDRVEMRQALDESGWVTGRRATIQGNFDPNLLIDGDKEAIEEEAHNMVNDFGPRGLIGNLGGGLMGKEDPERVALFVQAVRNASMKAIKLGAGDKELTRTLGGPQ
uniref:Uroporphyrinogen decarboxylase (URO-D) domain-containing protein n=1 Tax=Amorphochlora amoebiformis TaxID=1561963 RepID=A0A6T6XQ67_9EUKA|mmetsp:Transcript_35024/g.56538  ORF Transcript_35024/g.56538 Transcript_35024/m.56538 type:complete len:158 (+) Transcript_35024:181-654(+)